MARSYSSSVANLVKRFLDDREWRYDFNSEKGIYEFDLPLKGKLKKVTLRVIIGDTRFTVYGYCPMNADEECRAQMAEFITRANYGLVNGNFEMDYRDGELRYKSFVDCEDTNISNEIVKNSVITVVAMFMKYEPGILAVLFGLKSAEDAVKECEKD